MNKREFLKMLGAGVLGGGVASLFHAPTQDKIQSSNDNEDVIARIQKTGVLRAAYIVWPPEFDRDPVTGQFSGICYEIAEEMAKRMGITIEWVEQVNFGTMFEGFATNRYDVVCFSSYRLSSKSLVTGYTTPIFYSGMGVYVRASDTRFDKDLKILNGSSFRVGTIDGEMSQIIAQQDFPKAKVIALPQQAAPAQLLMNIRHKKIDAAFVNRLTAAQFMERNPGLIKEVNMEEPIRFFSHGFVYGKEEIKWGEAMNITLAEMHDHGFIARTLEKYNRFSDAFMPLAKPYQ